MVFRCDGSPEIGLGHAIRCWALAAALREMGTDICFIMQESSKVIGSIIQGAGFIVHNMPDTLRSGDFSLAESDFKYTLGIMQKNGAECVVIDHYGASTEYMNKFKDNEIKIAVTDDLADRDLTAADWILNQNLGASELRYRARPDCIMLLGPKYALLKPEFAKARRNLPRKFSDNDNKILLTLGGGNLEPLYVQILNTLNNVSRTLAIRCVFGGNSPVPNQITEIVSVSKHEIQIFQNLEDMTPHMTWADVSINAGGSTCWELCCLGVPMIITVIADNQRKTATALEKHGCAFNLGKWDTETYHNHLIQNIDKLLNDANLRSIMSSKERALVDGQGAERAAKSLVGLFGHEN